MKKLTLVLILGLVPYHAYAYRTGPETCNNTTSANIPLGYCCIAYTENGNNDDHLWKCDNLDLSPSTMEDCKTARWDCVNYCNSYDLDNNTCSDKAATDPCDGWEMVENEIYGTNCTIPYAEHCEYQRYCDLCGNNCYNENEEVTDCIDGYYMTEDYTQCLKCPGNGVVDYDIGNMGIIACYIPRDTMTGSDSTGTFSYINDKCYYRE